ncbi:hypothetical protein ALC57_11458, partial [Trachymyrmex cornetzi]
RSRSSLFRQGSRCSLRHVLAPENFPSPREMRLTSRHRPMLLAVENNSSTFLRLANHPNRVSFLRDRRKVHCSLFLSRFTTWRREREKKDRQTRNAPLGKSEYPMQNFPRENHLIPQPRSLFPQTGMKYLFAYASLGPAAVSELPAR